MRLLGGATCALILSAGAMNMALAQNLPSDSGTSSGILANQGALAAPAYLSEASMQDDFLRQETVTTRQHPETQAQGINTGSWQIFPKVGVEEKYNDNIYATESGKISDQITTINPDVFVRSNWNNGQATFDASSSNAFHARHQTEDSNDYQFAGTGRLDITRQEYLSAHAGYYFLHEDRTSPNNNFGVVPTTYGLTDAGLEFYDKLNRLSFTLDGNLDKYDYNNVGNGTGGFIPNTDRSRNEYLGSARIGYELQTLFEAYVKAVGSDRSYDHKVATDGYERSSTGYAVTTGVALDLGGVTFGEVGIGYMNRDYEDHRFGSVGGLTGNVAVTWNATPLTTLKLTGQRTIEETITFASPAFVSTLGQLSVDHELLRNLLLNAFGTVNYNDYKENTRRDTIYGGGLGATYLMNRNVNIAAKFSYRDQLSTDGGLGFKQNLALVRLTAQM